jgi:hypothetical protein
VRSLHACTYARTPARTHACTHARTHARMHARMHTRTHARTRTRTHALMHDTCIGCARPVRPHSHHLRTACVRCACVAIRDGKRNHHRREKARFIDMLRAVGNGWVRHVRDMKLKEENDRKALEEAEFRRPRYVTSRHVTSRHVTHHAATALHRAVLKLFDRPVAVCVVHTLRIGACDFVCAYGEPSDGLRPCVGMI